MDALHLRLLEYERHRERAASMIVRSWRLAGLRSTAFRTTLVRCAKKLAIALFIYLIPASPPPGPAKSRAASCGSSFHVKLSLPARIYHFFEFFIIAAMSRRLCSSVCANCIALVLPSLWKAETEKMKPFFLTL